MCGICGKINFDNKPVENDELIRMRDCMIHRGPDDEGFFLESFIGLGHRRLSIIDIEGGHQPISNENDTIIIVFNGEIYNFKSLRKQLIKSGHVLKTNSDTEVILHLYEEEGVDCIEKLRGMFAFAIWDRTRQELFLARDRLGIKPLYYYTTPRTFLFASEIKALLQCCDVNLALNESGLMRYLKYRFVYGAQTLFENVYELLPGHFMLVTKTNITIKQYWCIPPPNNTVANFNELKTQLMSTLEESVRLRMVSDVPIGVFLSGGVDSSAVTGLMSRSSSNINTFSIGFKPEELNELTFARQIAHCFCSDHHEYFLESADFFPLLKKLIWHHDEPLIFPASIPLYLLSKNSKNSATVMLAGEGSDEIFAGYSENVKAYWLHRLGNFLPQTIKSILPRIIVNSKYRRIFSRTTLPDWEQIRSFFQIFNNDFIYRAYHWGDQEDFDDEELLYEIGYHQNRGSFLNKLLYFQMKTYLVALLMKQDKMSMAASIESRVPFLDHHLVEIGSKIPDQLRIKGKQGKYIFKKACEGLLPRDIIYRKKMGFPVPIDKWFREKNNPYLAVLLDPTTKRKTFLNYKLIQQSIKRFLNNEPNASMQIWTLLNIELWRRIFFENEVHFQ